MKGYELKVEDKSRCKVILEKHGYRKARNCDAFIKRVEVDIDTYIEQTVYVNDIIIFTVEKAEEETEPELAVIYEMLTRKAVSIVVVDKEEPYTEKYLNKECVVKSSYLRGEYYAWIVAVPNEKVARWKHQFLVEFRGMIKPEWAKKDIFELSGRDTYNHTFGDCGVIFQKAWVSLNEIKEIIR